MLCGARACPDPGHDTSDSFLDLISERPLVHHWESSTVAVQGGAQIAGYFVGSCLGQPSKSLLLNGHCPSLAGYHPPFGRTCMARRRDFSWHREGGHESFEQRKSIGTVPGVLS